MIISSFTNTHLIPTGPGMAASALKLVALLLFLCSRAAHYSAAATWCVARSDASDQALQTALDYACGSGADCAPIGSSGLCYLPNTVQAHASYAFNSYFQRKGNAPGSCSFAGTASVARTDPSYGSCDYPSSPSTAGGMVASGGTSAGATIPGTIPYRVEPPPQPAGTTSPQYGNEGGFTPAGMGMGSTGFPDSPNTSASSPPILTLQKMLSFATFLHVSAVICLNFLI